MNELLTLCVIVIDWNPIGHFGPIPINWYGITWAIGILVSAALARRAAVRAGSPVTTVNDVVLWASVGSFAGARLYYVVQNDFGAYLREPWRILAVWEGGLAFFGDDAALGRGLYKCEFLRAR